MTEVADLYVVLRSVGGQFERGMARAGAAAGEADGKIAGVAAGIRGMALGAAGAGVLVAGAALKMSGEFDRLMEQLHTLAHVPQKDIAPLSHAVLNLAGQVGFSPNSLAEALYHVSSTFASTGISGKKMMDILAVGAKGAQIGGANIVDVMNALDAAVVSGIPGVKNINQAMGALLATVGAGDMTMQNLAESLGTGILAVAKQYGATLADVGAGLATFGDNNIRGAKAATELRMAIMDLTMQSQKGADVLKDKLGIQYNQLGHDMQKGGMIAALKDLKAHLDAAGITGTRVGEVLGQAFTKKSSAPLAILIGEMGQLTSKYPELKKGATGFGDAWKHTSELMSTKAKEAKANIESAFIGLGHMLQPIAKKILDMFNGAFSWAKHHKKTIEELARVLKVVLVGAIVLVSVVLGEMIIEMAIAAAPFILLAAAIGLAVKWFMNLYNHNAKVREFVTGLVKALKVDAVAAVHWLIHAFQEAKKWIGEAIHAVIGFYESHKKTIDGMVKDVVSVLQDLWSAFQTGFQAVVAIVKTAVKIIVDLWDRFGKNIWQHIVTAWHAIVQTVRGYIQIFKGIFEMIIGLLTGHWSKFWKGICDLVDGAWNVVSGLFKTALNLLSTILGAGVAALSAIWGFLWHAIETLAVNAWHGIVHVGHDLYNWFVKLPWNIIKKIGNAAMWLYNIGKNFIIGLLHGIADKIETLWNWCKQLPSAVFNLVNKLYDWMLTVGHNIIMGIWNGIVKMASWLWDKVKGWMSDLWNGIKDFFGIGSPSRLMADTVGKHIATGMAVGILENKHHVMKALKKVADEAANQQVHMGGRLGMNHLLKNGSFHKGHNLGSGSGETIIYVTVKGEVIDTQGLFKVIQQVTQQHNSRNPSNGLTFRR